MVITMVLTLLLTATSAAVAKYYLIQSEAGHQVLLLPTYRSSTLLSGKKEHVTHRTCHPKLHYGLMISVMGNQVPPEAIYQTIVNS
jgi:hypothetical protein